MHPAWSLAGLSTLLVFCPRTKAVKEAKANIWFSLYLRTHSSLRSGSVYSHLSGGLNQAWNVVGLTLDSLLFALLLLFLARCSVNGEWEERITLEGKEAVGREAERMAG